MLQRGNTPARNPAGHRDRSPGSGKRKAFQTLSGRDAGVLCAPTAFGKTVVALKLIASRGVNTLILVHRKTMADQWRRKLLTFLSLREVEIGWWIVVDECHHVPAFSFE